MRLSAYIAPSLCILDCGESNLALWYNDSRRSGTVHATELRWLRFDEDSGVLSVHMVTFPEAWTEAARLIQDREFAATSNWETVFQYFNDRGWMLSVPLVDGLESVAATTDHGDADQSRHVTYRLATTDADVKTLVSASLRVHRKPK